MFFPCIATFIVLLKELGLTGLLKSTLVMVIAALLTGGLLNLILH
jgi:ferrous iron transport protein B